MLSDRPGHRVRGRSSSAAKNALAALRISLARRSSRTSRSSAAIRSLSWVLIPGRCPPSTSAWRTQSTVGGDLGKRRLAQRFPFVC
jgi:hypothetical protein